MASSSPIPLLDVAPLLARDPEGERNIAEQMGAACRGIGFFYVTDHGIAPAEMQAVSAKAAAFFTRDGDFKTRSAFTGTSSNRGYVRLGGESLDPTKPPDVKEAFNIGLELAADDPDLLGRRRPFRAPNFWPEVTDFRAIMLDYFNRMWSLGRTLHRAFALDLGLPPDYFDDKFDKPLATLRLLHYPPTEAPLREGQLGAGEHTDYGNVTLLATDSSGGLMVRDRSGNWLSAPVIPGRVRLQHRRLPDALDQRRLRLDAAQGGDAARQGPLLDRVLPRSRSGRDRRLPADLHGCRPARALRAGDRRRLSEVEARSDLQGAAGRGVTESEGLNVA